MAAALAAPAAGAAEPWPWDLAVETVWGAPAGPTSVLEDLEAELLIGLRGRACFRSVTRFDPESEAREDALVLRLRLDGFREEVQYEATIAERAAAQEPGIERKLVAEFRGTARLELLDSSSGAVLRSLKVYVVQRARPVASGQDDRFAREEARRNGVDELASETARRLCRGSARKLERALEKARNEARTRGSAR